MVTTDNDDEEFTENKTHLQNLENNFDLVVNERNISELFQMLNLI